MALLQSSGIAAGAVQDIEDALEHDAGLQARGALVTLQHALLGPFGHVRTPLDFATTPLAPYRAPSLGEHNAEIAITVAGIDPARVAELAALEVFK